MAELNVLTVNTLEVEDISRVLAISKNEEVVALDPTGIKPDLTDYAKKDEVPTKVSELENDSDFVTSDDVDEKIAASEMQVLYLYPSAGGQISYFDFDAFEKARIALREDKPVIVYIHKAPAWVIPHLMYGGATTISASVHYLSFNKGDDKVQLTVHNYYFNNDGTYTMDDQSVVVPTIDQLESINAALESI